MPAATPNMSPGPGMKRRVCTDRSAQAARDNSRSRRKPVASLQRGAAVSASTAPRLIPNKRCERRRTALLPARPKGRVLAGCRRHQRATGRSAGPAQLPLDRLSEILQEMKSVGDLTSLRRPFTRALSEQTAQISTDDFDLGATSQPIGRRRG